MRSFKTLILTFLLILITSTESYTQSSYNIHVGPAIPLSDFASDDIDDEDAGGAEIGINIGFQYTYQVIESGLGLFAGLDFNYNGLQKDVKDDVEQALEYLGIRNADLDYYKYFNIPISAGLVYKYDANDKIALLINSGVIMNLLKISDFVIKVSGEKITTEFDLAHHIGLKVGGGIWLNSRISIMVDYLGLGKHDIDGKMKAGGFFSEDVDMEQKVDMLTVTIGLSF